MQYLMRAADDAEDPQLAKLIRKGVAIHNSGLSPGDRGLVERAFLSGRWVILRSTLASWLGVGILIARSPFWEEYTSKLPVPYA